MNLEPLRAALKGDADATATRRRAEAEEAGARRLADAREQAAAIVEQARLEGEQAAATETRRRRAAATRRARELRLQAERSLLDELRARAHDGARELRADPRYPALLERLSEAARLRLGASAVLELDPPDAGGVRAHAGSVSVDYSLPALVDRAIDDLGVDLEGLWR